MAAPFTGARPLLKVSVHQDARNIAPWAVLISVLSASSILLYRWVYPDPSDRIGLATAITSNPALRLIFGPPRDLMTNDGFNAWRAGSLGAFFAGLMAILIVVRNSRADEDSGRAELIAAGVITRQARLLVSVLIAVVAAFALGVVCFLLTWASGGQIVPTLVLSATFTASALMYAGVAAVAAQIGSDARTANAIGIGVLGLSWVIRGYLDSSGAPEWTRWLTPLGWLEQAYPATENNLWPLVPAVGLMVALLPLALMLQQHRDFGLGMLSPRPGPATAPGLSLGGLAIRLHRGLLLTWMLAFAFLGVVFGTLATTIADVLADNPMMGAIIASGAVTKADLSFGFVAAILGVIGIIAAVAGAQVVQRMYAEEIDYRVEPILAGSVARPRYFGSNVVIALVGSALALLVSGLTLGFVASRGDVGIRMGDVLLQAICTIPAVWVLVGVSVAAVGAKPSRRFVGWLAIVAAFAITLLGPTFKLPDVLLGVSPLHHVPIVVQPSPSWISLVGLGLVAAWFLTVGFVGFRRRDLL